MREAGWCAGTDVIAKKNGGYPAAWPDIPRFDVRAGRGAVRALAGWSNQRLLNWKERRALARPYFLRSTTRESRVRKPAAFRMPRSVGS